MSDITCLDDLFEEITKRDNWQRLQLKTVTYTFGGLFKESIYISRSNDFNALICYDTLPSLFSRLSRRILFLQNPESLKGYLLRFDLNDEKSVYFDRLFMTMKLRRTYRKIERSYMRKREIQNMSNKDMYDNALAMFNASTLPITDIVDE